MTLYMNDILLEMRVSYDEVVKVLYVMIVTKNIIQEWVERITVGKLLLALFD